MQKETCQTCWAKWGVDLWTGKCVCTGDVSLKKPEPTYSNPIPPRKEPKYKVCGYGDGYTIQRIDSDGRSVKIGPMFDHGTGLKGLTFPKDLLLNFQVFSCKQKAEDVLNEYLRYLEDIKAKNSKKTKS